MKRAETMLEIRKYTTFLNVINKPNVYKFLKDFTKNKKDLQGDTGLFLKN